MEEILGHAETIFYWMANVAGIAAWAWTIYVILRALPLVLSNQRVRLENLIISGVAILAVLLAIIYVPPLVVDAIGESYDRTMPGLDALINRIVDDAREGYNPPGGPTITVQDAPGTPPPPQQVNGSQPAGPTPTDDPYAGGDIMAPEDFPTAGPMPTEAVPTPQFTLMPSPTPRFQQAAPTPATPTPEPTIDPLKWRPGTPAPTPLPGQWDDDGVWP